MKLPIAKPAYVVYAGPSALNGDPIIAILTGTQAPSQNVKTGPMAQLWILVDDETPQGAQRSGADAAVCGNCPMRPLSDSGEPRCYVKTFQGPLATWKSRRSDTPDLAGALRAVSGMALRLGAYGDPAAIPESSGIVQSLCDSAVTWTGYTHQWRAERHRWLQPYCMASVESDRDAWRAWREGWRTFRVARQAQSHALGGYEVECPYTSRGVQCIDCGLCMGSSRAAKSIVITAH